MCYASVVSREPVRISTLDASLNTFDLLSCDTQNECFSALCREKTCCRVGSEFRSDAGETMIEKVVLPLGLCYRKCYVMWDTGHQKSMQT